MTEYDMDHRGREENLWAEALEIISTTTMAERTIRYITLNKPESESAEVNAEDIQLAPDAILRNLTLPQPASVPPARHRNEPLIPLNRQIHHSQIWNGQSDRSKICRLSGTAADNQNDIA
jgi:intracellular multiplication protein IcmO